MREVGAEAVDYAVGNVCGEIGQAAVVVKACFGVGTDVTESDSRARYCREEIVVGEGTVIETVMSAMQIYEAGTTLANSQPVASTALCTASSTRPAELCRRQLSMVRAGVSEGPSPSMATPYHVLRMSVCASLFPVEDGAK